jgi:plasmid segregation protein ParM
MKGDRKLILGIDVGNYATKASPDVIFKSSVETLENIMGNKIKLELNGEVFYIGESNIETMLNKAKKTNIIPLLTTAILLSTKDICNSVVLGLPIGQFKEHKEDLKERILSFKFKNLKLNDEPRNLIIKECEIYPESLATYYSLNINKDCIIVDIGGRTTDICYIRAGKLMNNSTLAIGTLNIYSDVSRYLNNKYALNIDHEHAEKIIQQGYLKVDGADIDLSFIKATLRDNFIKINRELELNYPVSTEQIILTGGGGKLFENAFNRRYKTILADNYIYSNAIGFKKVAEMIF